MTDAVDYYLEWDCPSCDETNYYGICRTSLEHNGLPTIPFDVGACESYVCGKCGEGSYTGDLELMTDE